MLDFNTELISSEQELMSLVAELGSAPALALDIETINWWDRETERVALIQIAFREGRELRVAVIDALADMDLEYLRAPLESSTATKAIHNAAYDAVRLSHHFKIQISPIHDTMLAARRSGERRYSLQAQAQTYLDLWLDKDQQRSDWSRRPIPPAQLRYAALDAVCTLALYEDQIGRGLVGKYQLPDSARSQQSLLPLDADSLTTLDPMLTHIAEEPERDSVEGLSVTAQALLGVVVELAGRYSPDRLAASVGSQRVGIAGWIIDRFLDPQTDIDEDTAKLCVVELCERKLIRLTMGRRLEATDSGARLWRELKPV